MGSILEVVPMDNIEPPSALEHAREGRAQGLVSMNVNTSEDIQSSPSLGEVGDGARDGDDGDESSRMEGDQQRPTARHAQQQRQQDHQQQQEFSPRYSRSASAPNLTRRPSRLQTFVAGLVCDVEEYVGRGGYELTADDIGGTQPRTRTRTTTTLTVDQLENEASLFLSDNESPPDVREGHDGVGEWAGVGFRHHADPSWFRKGWGDRWRGRGAAGARNGGRGDQGGVEGEGLAEPLLSDVALGSPDDGSIAQDQQQPEAMLLRARSFSAAQYGGNSVGRTVVTFVKGMVGSFVLYLPHLFAEGGMIFSVVTLVLMAVFSTYNMLLLLRVREKLLCSGTAAYSYGEVGRAALGRAGWAGVDVSLFLSQLGYCVAYLIFVAQNLGPTIRPVLSSDYSWLASTVVLVLLQACVQVPLAWVRRLKYLGVGMLVANICVVGGLSLILVEIGKKLAKDGVAGEGTGGLVLINRSKCLIVLGSVVGCFEGTGLIIPIQDAMELKARDRLPAALCWSMVGITTFLMAFGAGGYLAYGAHVSPFITVDLDDGSIVVAIVRIVYSLGLILTSPLQLFPAVKVMERLFWPASHMAASKTIPDRRRKWLKNFLRATAVGFTVLVALVAGSRYDSFVGILGGVCAVPLALVYPVWFHVKLFGKLDEPWQRAIHYLLLAIGVFAGVASTVVAVLAL